MDGIGIPILGALASLALFLLSSVTPPLRRFALAALTAPFLASVVLLFGSFVLADMNPAREYGAAYIPSGREHNPTRTDFFLLCLAVGVTFYLSGYAAFIVQRRATKKRKSARFASSEEMDRRMPLATEFYEEVLAPDEDPAFVSDEATLRDISLEPYEELARKVEEHYGYRMSGWDFERSFWSLLDELQRSRRSRFK
jgi:hypothetical protein